MQLSLPLELHKPLHDSFLSLFMPEKYWLILKGKKNPTSYTCRVMKVGWKLSYGHNYFCSCLEATAVSRARNAGWGVGTHAKLVTGLSQLPGGGFTAGSRNAAVAKAVWSRASNWTLVFRGWVAGMNMGDGKFPTRSVFVFAVRKSWGNYCHPKLGRPPAGEPCREVLTSSISLRTRSTSPLPPHFCLMFFSQVGFVVRVVNFRNMGNVFKTF